LRLGDGGDLADRGELHRPASQPVADIGHHGHAPRHPVVPRHLGQFHEVLHPAVADDAPDMAGLHGQAAEPARAVVAALDLEPVFRRWIGEPFTGVKSQVESALGRQPRHRIVQGPPLITGMVQNPPGIDDVEVLPQPIAEFLVQDRAVQHPPVIRRPGAPMQRAGRGDRVRIIVEAGDARRPRGEGPETVDAAAAANIEKGKTRKSRQSEKIQQMPAGDLRPFFAKAMLEVLLPIGTKSEGFASIGGI
jgi:hypothetical protein